MYKLSADRKCLKAGQSILCLLSRHSMAIDMALWTPRVQ